LLEWMRFASPPSPEPSYGRLPVIPGPD